MKEREIGEKGVYIGSKLIYGIGEMGKEGVKIEMEIIRKEMEIKMEIWGKREINEIEK